ncbi:MAG: hypothetical protein KGI27_06185 [Thaumarchaeota archaeon]|nr:hypothetical protein [Nitrososphaerota archaeon]
MKFFWILPITILLAIILQSNQAYAQNETTPTIWFDHASYATREMSCYSYETGKTMGEEQKIATITVTDPAANKYSASIDRVTVFVWSDSDRKGIQITAYETEVNSGIFKGTVTITEGWSTQNLIHVRDGDTITAKYAGSNPWSIGTQNQGVTTTAFIGMLCPPLERVPASGINITDNEGNPQRTILVNRQIQIGSKLDNITIRNQTFAYIVQISDEHQNVVSLSSVSGLLLPSKTFSPSVSWTPPSAGDYTVQIFVWQSINNPNSLSPPLLSELTVLPNVSVPNSTAGFENRRCQAGYELVAKSDNNATACVTPETAQILADRGWGHLTASIGPSAMSLENSCRRFSPAPDDQPSLRVTPVLLMKSNSTACARLTFTVVSNFKDCNGMHCSSLVRFNSTLNIGNVRQEKNNYGTSVTPAKDYTHSFKIKVVPETVDLANQPLGSKFTVTYIIRALSNATGFYDSSVLKGICNSYPLAVGYSADEVNASDFTYINSVALPCPAGLYQLSGVEISGMSYAEVKLH